jgi:hypothetical protein
MLLILLDINLAMMRGNIVQLIFFLILFTLKESNLIMYKLNTYLTKMDLNFVRIVFSFYLKTATGNYLTVFSSGNHVGNFWGVANFSRNSSIWYFRSTRIIRMKKNSWNLQKAE